jgi:SET domain
VSWPAVLGSFAAFAQVVAYLGYLRLFLAGKIQPNAASWFMFAYGTGLMAFMEYSSDAHWFELALPIACASMSVIVAVLCLRKKAMHAIERSEKITFAADVLVTIAYLISAALLSGHKEFVVLFIVAGNITTVTSFAPIVISTFKEPHREHPMPWAIWTVAYSSLFLSTALAEGFSSPELLLYPGLCAVLHGLVSVFSLRAALSSGILRLPEARIATLPAKAALTSTRLASPSLQPFATKLSQPLRNHLIPNLSGVPNVQQAAPHAMQMTSATLAVQPSAIAGRGIHATVGFANQEEICALSGTILLDVATDASLNSIGIARGVWVDPEFPLVFINHSCEPNSAFRYERTLFALRAIAPGEEVTMDYSTTEADIDWSMHCSCGAAQCRSTLTSIQIAFANASEAPPATVAMQQVWRDEHETFRRPETTVTFDLTNAEALADS